MLEGDGLDGKKEKKIHSPEPGLRREEKETVEVFIKLDRLEA